MQILWKITNFPESFHRDYSTRSIAKWTFVFEVFFEIILYDTFGRIGISDLPVFFRKMYPAE